MANDARQVLLAQKWSDAKDPTGMWMSEKLDGVRGYWSGSCFYSRQGNPFKAPAWFTKDLPKEPLDGELWCGRGLFKKALSIVKCQKDSVAGDWKYITYLVFDAPKHGGTYEERVKWIEANIRKEKQTTYAAAVGVQRCDGAKHLKQTLKSVLKKGGEGLMLRTAGSKYVNGRSDTLLKVKHFHDEECRVTGHLRGTGRCQDMMGKLQCELPNGITFKVGTGFTDVQRRNPPPTGSIITFKYQECSDKGTPRFPVFLRARPDLTWADIVANAKTKVPWSQVKQVKPELKKQHSILFSTVPSRSSSGAKVVTTDDEDSGDEEAQANRKGKASKPAKPLCKYGATCYRTNADHLARFSHGDAERTAPIAPAPTAQSAAASPGKAAPPALPQCPYGAECYRRSEAHLREYSHPSAEDVAAAAASTEEDALMMRRGVSLDKIDLDDYFDVGLSEDEVEAVRESVSGTQGEWGLGGGGGSSPPARKKAKTQGTQGAGSVTVSSDEWEAVQARLRALEKQEP